ncbi:hypothetical protein ADUPG1_013452, partial [Aduncisulcus paluster]
DEEAGIDPDDPGFLKWYKRFDYRMQSKLRERIDYSSQETRTRNFSLKLFLYSFLIHTIPFVLGTVFHAYCGSWTLIFPLIFLSLGFLLGIVDIFLSLCDFTIGVSPLRIASTFTWLIFNILSSCIVAQLFDLAYNQGKEHYGFVWMLFAKIPLFSLFGFFYSIRAFHMRRNMSEGKYNIVSFVMFFVFLFMMIGMDIMAWIFGPLGFSGVSGFVKFEFYCVMITSFLLDITIPVVGFIGWFYQTEGLGDRLYDMFQLSKEPLWRAISLVRVLEDEPLEYFAFLIIMGLGSIVILVSSFMLWIIAILVLLFVILAVQELLQGVENVFDAIDILEDEPLEYFAFLIIMGLGSIVILVSSFMLWIIAILVLLFVILAVQELLQGVENQIHSQYKRCTRSQDWLYWVYTEGVRLWIDVGLIPTVESRSKTLFLELKDVPITLRHVVDGIVLCGGAILSVVFQIALMSTVDIVPMVSMVKWTQQLIPQIEFIPPSSVIISALLYEFFSLNHFSLCAQSCGVFLEYSSSSELINVFCSSIPGYHWRQFIG